MLSKKSLFCDIRQIKDVVEQDRDIVILEIMELGYDEETCTYELFTRVVSLPLIEGLEENQVRTFNMGIHIYSLDHLKSFLEEDRYLTKAIWVPVRETLSSLFEKVRTKRLKEIILDKDFARDLYLKNVGEINRELEKLGWFL